MHYRSQKAVPLSVTGDIESIYRYNATNENFYNNKGLLTESMIFNSQGETDTTYTTATNGDKESSVKITNAKRQLLETETNDLTTGKLTSTALNDATSGQTTKTIYNAAGQITEVDTSNTATGNLLTKIQYNTTTGKEESSSIYNSATSGQITSRTIYDQATGNTLFTQSYTYNATGQVTSFTKTDPSGTIDAQNVTTYGTTVGKFTNSTVTVYGTGGAAATGAVPTYTLTTAYTTNTDGTTTETQTGTNAKGTVTATTKTQISAAGITMKQVMYNSTNNPTSINTYNATGQLTATNTFSASGTPLTETDFTYNTSGQTITQNYNVSKNTNGAYTENTTGYTYTKPVYDTDGNLAKQNTYNASGTMLNSVILNIASGATIETITYNTDGSEVQTIFNPATGAQISQTTVKSTEAGYIAPISDPSPVAPTLSATAIPAPPSIPTQLASSDQTPLEIVNAAGNKVALTPANLATLVNTVIVDPSGKAISANTTSAQIQLGLQNGTYISPIQ